MPNYRLKYSRPIETVVHGGEDPAGGYPKDLEAGYGCL